MFGGATSTEYDDIVIKTTDENLTSENWELILNLCDKVQDEGQTGAHNAIAAILKRLAHRNPNVQLYALSLTESLSKNLGIEIHRELASRAFTQGLEKLITDRNTHEKVRRRALGLIALWTAEFEKDESLGIMEDCYNNLKAKNYKFEQPDEPAPPTIDDDIRRKEEEELQRVLEMSMQDRGGRGQWADYSLAGASASGAGTGTSSGGGSSGVGGGVGRSGSVAAPSTQSSSSHPFAQPKYQAGGYAPARTPSPASVAAQQRKLQAEYLAAQQAQAQQAQTRNAPAGLGESFPPTLSSASTSAPTASTSSIPATTSTVPTATSAATTTAPAPAPAPAPSQAPNMTLTTRVRALHTFEASEPGELAFEQGDVIKVVDRGYKDWWRGQLKGRTGIFPVNYVEAMPEPTAAELAKEAEQEAAVFAQAVNVEKLLNMLRALDPVKDNLADNEEIQELYRSSMALRPKIVKLIDKYSQKRADLVSMNEAFVRARSIFDRMMEESLARHTAVYDQPYHRPSAYGHPHPHAHAHAQGRPESAAAARRAEYGPSPVNGPGPGPGAYGWGAPLPAGAVSPGGAGYEQPGYAGYGAPGGYGMAPGPGPVQVQGTPGPGHGQQGYQQQQVPQQVPQQQQQQMPQQQQQIPQQQQQQQQVPAGYGVVPQGGYAGHQPNAPYSQQGPTPYPTQQQQVEHQQQQQQQQPQQQYNQLQPQQQQQPIQQLQQQQQPIQQQQQPIQPAPQQQAQPIHQQQQQLQQPIQAVQAEVVQAQPQPAAAAAVSPQPQPQAQSQPHTQAQAQPQAQSQPPQPQPQAQVLAQAHSQQHDPQQPISGPPPYVYNPAYTYADPNVQAWAQYYAQGGRDLAGAVYFLAIPGVTEGVAGQAQGQAQGQGAAQGAASPQRQQSLETKSEQQQQTVQRQQSYQGQGQGQAQAQPGEGEFAYGALRAVSPGVQQQQQPLQNATMPRYQLQDQPISQAQPQLQPQQQQQPQYANQYGAETGKQQASPTSPVGPGSSGFQQQQQRPGTAGSYHSPTQNAATPSWLLPKKSTPPGPGQFGGVSLSDPGNGSAPALL